ncbi:Hypothetical protein EUBREC_2579 [Agathobacter rectalis ATCC 33656]|uniref:Uncharacterized protein n=1 Tax=Agathobacter rectalis (strain ATCC 33656 / DSM 3377 / JCM 17463 / KCTC 5835 / VPI 0990) TaxID=515619 RepID=C4ZGA4_AGARV|nr:Hypothetical protein EUBREC_2579 [Agathobacter rectalis ATCC 33656]
MFIPFYFISIFFLCSILFKNHRIVDGLLCILAPGKQCSQNIICI